ncbi:Trihelix transcription factor GT-2 [Quillaja saponaria]|uniref:Trihelix transcription factor GT-2 n=1 Tax=Quillaja saponaria TaxID=32244 RepID=A0AAD7PWB9_QUISA|nr:Trihelix transcription factor GT-2 [Quillaja saponaria]
MLGDGDSSVLVTSGGDAVMAVAAAATEEARDVGEKGKVRDGDGGNRWPRQETLALLKIRSDMDAVFRDSSLKAPLWEEVSRKLADLGYNRSAKKCKEKFENVYKYHKRTKEGRSGKREGKTYRFFDELQAFENQFTVSHHHSKPQQSRPLETARTIDHHHHHSPSISRITTTIPLITNPTIITNPPQNNISDLPNMSIDLLATTTSTSSATASDDELEEIIYKKKRKWKDYFKRVTRNVIMKQEEMQAKFFAAIDKRERERMTREDAWRIQEMSRINREHEILVQERSTEAAKDAALVAFLQKLSGQVLPANPANVVLPIQQPCDLPSQQPPPQQQQPPRPVPPMVASNNLEIPKMDNGQTNNINVAIHDPVSSSSRWPKVEVHALINLKRNSDFKYQENGPKGALWEEISTGMKRLGYNRSSKRCKEKWENINKYYKRVKERNKTRPEDCKTCPYFHRLDALYKEKNLSIKNSGNIIPSNMMMEPLMVQPEQQWRPPPQNEPQSSTAVKDDDIDGEDADEDEEGSMGDGGSAGNYETVTNKLLSSSMDTVE